MPSPHEATFACMACQRLCPWDWLCEQRAGALLVCARCCWCDVHLCGADPGGTVVLDFTRTPAWRGLGMPAPRPALGERTPQ